MFFKEIEGRFFISRNFQKFYIFDGASPYPVVDTTYIINFSFGSDLIL